MSTNSGEIVKSAIGNKPLDKSGSAVGAARVDPAEAVAGNRDIIGQYHDAVAGGTDPLPFAFCVPRGLSSNGSRPVPNVVETGDPALIFTAEFSNEETWRELHLSEYNLK